MKINFLQFRKVLSVICLTLCGVTNLNSQIISTFAGTGSNNYDGDNLPALASSLSVPECIGLLNLVFFLQLAPVFTKGFAVIFFFRQR
jgi:hypothetical protein